MYRQSIRRFLLAAAAVLATGAVACSGSGSPTGPDSSASSASGSSTGGSSNAGVTSGGTGSLRINLTDSPFSDAKALLVTFSSVSVHRSDGDAWQTIPFASGSSRTCDLKKLNGPTDVLGVGTLPAGHYTQVRLEVSSASIYFDNASSGSACAASITEPAGTSASVDIPSGEVKLNQEFDVTTGGTTMLLDFDGDQSVRQTGSANSGGNGNGNSNGRGGSNSSSTTKYMMSPVIRVVSVQ